MTIFTKQTGQPSLESVRANDNYPLSPIQQGLIFHSLYAPRSGFYVVQFSLRMSGLNKKAFQRAWQQVVDRHEILRTAFVQEGVGEAMQVVQRELTCEWKEQDWRGVEEEERERRLQAYVKQDREQGFEFSRAPLMRLALMQTGEEEYEFLWTYHHVLLDGWSVPLVVKEILGFYEANCQGRELQLQVPRPYREYIAWLEKQEEKEAESFWREELKGMQTPTRLGIDEERGGAEAEAGEFRQERIRLSRELSEQLQALGRKHQLTLNTVFQGAWALLLSQYSGEETVVFGTTVAGRPAELRGVEEMVGNFINTVPLRVEVKGEQELIGWLQGIQRKHVAIRQYEHTSLVKIQSWTDVPRGTPLFESVIGFQNYPADWMSFSDDRIATDFSRVQVRERSHHPITVLIIPGRQIEIAITVKTSAAHKGAAVDLRHLEQLVIQIAENPGRRIGDLELLCVSERNQVLRDWNQTEALFPRGHCIHHLFENQARRSPDAIAAASDGNYISYAELNSRANSLARYLRQRGVSTGSVVAIMIEHSINMLVGLAGILKSGAAYLPIDPECPTERLRYMLDHAGVGVIVTEQRLAATSKEYSSSLVFLDRDWGQIEKVADSDLPVLASDRAPAYVMYTSGSSGDPKAVCVSHRALVNYVWFANNVYLGNDRANFALHSSLAFDLTVTSIFCPLSTGRCVQIYKNATGGTVMFDIVRELEDGVVKLTPSQLALVVSNDNRKSGIRTIIVGGEALPTDLVRKTKDSFGSEVAIFNEYGPTETTVGCVFVRLEQVTEHPTAPIGRPAPNHKIYVLGPHLQPLPPQIVGDLYIAGAGLADGYLNDPVATARQFIPNPFDPQISRRMYRTGDIGCWLQDGRLLFCGRRDTQVKHHGYRVELEEIRQIVNRYPNVRDSVATTVTLPGERKGLVVYYVSPEDLEIAEIRKFMSRYLPASVIPQRFVHIGSIPLTSNGKVNYRALPPVAEPGDLTADSTPRTHLEETLCAIWADALQLDRVGIHDDFFALGGDSIVSVQIAIKARQAGISLDLPQIFRYPTVGELSTVIGATKRRFSRPSPTTALTKSRPAL